MDQYYLGEGKRRVGTFEVSRWPDLLEDHLVAAAVVVVVVVVVAPVLDLTGTKHACNRFTVIF